MPNEMPSLEADLGAVYDAAEADGEAAAPGPSAEVEQAAPAVTETAAPGAERGTEAPASGPSRDKQGKFTGKEQAPVVPAPAAPVVPTLEALKPPADWKPAAREKWGSIPREVQEEALRVHKEAKKVLQGAAEHRKTAEAFQQVVAPYRALLQGEPIRVVGSLLQTAAALQTGTPAQRAAVVAQVITGYSVDIEQLAAALEGKTTPQAQRQPAEFRDPRFDQFLGHLEQGQKQRREAAQRQHTEEIEAFKDSGQAEFFDDVLPEMLEVERAASAKGKTLTLQQVYERACMLNDDVRPLWEQRKSAQAAANAPPASTRAPARVASTSLRHEPQLPTTGKQKSLEADLGDTWDALSKGP